MRAILSFTDAPTQYLEIMDVSSGEAFIMTNRLSRKEPKLPSPCSWMLRLTGRLGGRSKLKPIEVIMNLFKDVKPDNKIGDRIWIKLKGVIKSSYN